jgi:hypothetical protein
MKRRQVRVTSELLDNAKAMYEAQAGSEMTYSDTVNISLAHSLGKEVIIRKKRRRMIVTLQ